MADELPKVIWSHNTSECRATKFTPFRLLYGAEAMTSEELKHQSLRSQCNNIEPSMEVDLAESDVLQALDNPRTYQEESRKWRGKIVIDKFVSVGDWVLKRKPNAEIVGKLQSKWDGPYLVLYSNRSGSYHLADLEANELQHPWNADSLTKYYV